MRLFFSFLREAGEGRDGGGGGGLRASAVLEVRLAPTPTLPRFAEEGARGGAQRPTPNAHGKEIPFAKPVV